MKRRSFIGKSGKIAAASTLGISTALSKESTSNRKDGKIGYAFVGLGNFASYVAPKLITCNHSALTGLVSSDRSKALEWAEKYNIPKKGIYDYENFDAILRNPDIDAVYLATPVGTHHEFAMRAFSAGKHVLTEKTMASTSAQCQDMIDAANRAGKKLMVAYRARYEPYNDQAIKWSREKTYGRVTSITAHKGFHIGEKFGKGNWRIKKQLAGGGALMDIGIYSIQACRYIAGAEPVEVCGFSLSTSGDRRFTEVEENLSFLLKFDNGILATGSASWNYSLQD